MVRIARPPGAAPAETQAPGLTRSLEVETKLDLDPTAELADLPRQRAVRTAGMTGWTDPVDHQLEATYFDTSGLDLLRSRVTLRRRTGGTDAGWHLKLPAGSGARTEIGLPLDATGHPPMVPGPLADLVAGAARGGELRPVARIGNHRTVRRLVDSDGRELVEIADDRVSATGLDVDGVATGPTRIWREVEAELLQGTTEQLGVAVAGLRKGGATPASAVSKLARALGEEPAHAGPGKAGKDRTAGAVICAATRRLRDELIAADLALRIGAGQDSESEPSGTPVRPSRISAARHDSRSTARRIRAVLKVFAVVFDPAAPPTLFAGLRRHGAALSAGRDLDAVAARLGAQLEEEPAGFAGPAIDEFQTEVQRRGALDNRFLSDYLDSPDYLAMLRGLDSFLTDPGCSRTGARPAADVLPAVMIAPWARMSRLAESMPATPDDSRAVHRVRKQAAALRYATEAVAPVLGDEAVVFAAALEEVQEVLGEYTDAVTAAALLTELVRSENTSGTAGFIFGRLHAFEQAAALAALEEFTDAWLRLADGDLFAGAFGPV